MPRNQTLEDALYLWAAEERGGVNHGYPKQVPWYTPAGYRESGRVVTEADRNTVTVVAMGISKLHQRDSEQVVALEWYYGTSPEMGRSREERVERVLTLMKKHEFYKALDRARIYLEGYMDSHGVAQPLTSCK